MKKSALIITASVFFGLTTMAHANIVNNIKVNSDSGSGDSNISVNVNNSVNTGNSVTSYSSTDSKTSIEMHQSGSGTSVVNLNGKEYKLNGPGDINVNNNSTSTTQPSYKPASSPSQSPSPTSSASASAKPTPNIEVNQSPTNPIQQIANLFVKIFSQLEKLF